jgi:hypothetical protein
MTTEVGARWSVRGVVRALAVGALAWTIGSGLGYLVAHEKPPEPQDRRALAPAGSNPSP